MGGYEEDMDDAKREQAEADAALPHCTCGEELEWDPNLRAWKCSNKGCECCCDQ